MKYHVQLIILNNHSKFDQLEQDSSQVTIFLVFSFFTTKHHFHSTNLVQDRILKIRNLLPNEPNLIKFGGIAHNYQQHKRQEYFSSAESPFRAFRLLHLLSVRRSKEDWFILRFLKIGLGSVGSTDPSPKLSQQCF